MESPGGLTTHDVLNHKVRVRCPGCRMIFHKRISRVVHGHDVACPFCHNEMRFHGLHDFHPNDTLQHYVHYIEERTAHPHFSAGD